MDPILSVEGTSDEMLEQGDEGGGRRQIEATRGFAAFGGRQPRHSRRKGARGEMT